MYTKYLFLIKNCQYTYNGNFRLKSSFVINNGANILFSNNRQYSQKIQYPRNLDFIEKKKSVRNYAVAIGILTLGVSFAAVPLYRIFCQSTGYGGSVRHDIGGEKIQNLKIDRSRPIKVKFNSDVGSKMSWQFKPQQKDLLVYPGETALAFYTATNPTDVPITGISTYNILPFNAAPYFNKIQCFCFEEQQLNPNEQVDMPVFFYIDPEFCDDPQMENINEIILSYTIFFEIFNKEYMWQYN
ncbi:cytochrome c oxidase assembly protein COX11, putative [Pediculus humanus corporis]|uniref:Cytochrome c oxidase assembly protein COX11, mitochondrial n=1 Tax=Pediculus humanus subsp. corporis TaxID=121224 RepID=E0VLR5_PEDHC|nr:cytochrome c oxidase assembly protein COX11, putative [Pediculus humanus corporis]EEB14321.1 cytochrome c oxidase assembly protein COX11, putative [Pediculus humanus corporis]